MSARGSPIRGLEPNVKEFSLQSYSLNAENQRLTQLLISKNNQIRTLVENNTRIKNTYEAQANAYRKTIQSLEKRLLESEGDRQTEYKRIKQQYEKLSKDEVSTLKTSHTNEIQFLFKEIAHLRASIQTYDSKIQVRDHEIITLRQSYERELALSTSQINNLNKKIILMEEDKLKQIKDLTNKRQLERSRTSGLVISKKESNQYIEKQLRKLNQEILQKTINIENLSRQVNKEKKRNEDTLKAMNLKINTLTQQYEAQLAEKQQYFGKIQKILKEQILEYKQKEIRLMNENESLQSTANILKKEIDNKEAVIKSKTEENFNLKNTVQKMREDHINEINNLMKQRRKRSSKSNSGSSRSLTSSMKDSAIVPANNLPQAPNAQELSSKLASFLPTVKEETSPQRKQLSQQLSHSNIVQEQNQDELARAIFHYDSIIQELKKSHQMQLEYFKINLDNSNSKLRQKQLELEDVLTRFSPLVKIHAQQKSLEEDRKERIQRHWKADLGILDIMLKKYKIRTF